MQANILPHQESLIARRKKLFESIDKGSCMLVLSNQFVTRNADVEYPFRQDSNFYYITGIDEDFAGYFIKKDFNGNKVEILFIQEKTHQEQIWTGPVNGKKKSQEISKISNISNFSKILETVEKESKNCQKFYFDPNGSYQRLRNDIFYLISSQSRRSTIENLVLIEKTNRIFRNLRMYKDNYEIKQMQIAANLGIKAHIQAIKNMRRNIKAGEKVWEYQVCADIYYEFTKKNCTWSYPAIVAGGNNACILHYMKNNQQLNYGELLLIDAGCEYNYYASDITRCYPISGVFTEAQKAIYELVLKANLESIQEVAKKDSTYLSYNQKSIEIITKGLIDLGLLKGSLEENLENKSYFKYYMHSAGHWLGLDVHDAGVFLDEKGIRSNIKLESGMAVTVEPGLYFEASDENIPQEFRGIGIRIEDNIIKTQTGIINLTQDMPKTIQEIEVLVT